MHEKEMPFMVSECVGATQVEKLSIEVERLQ